MTARLVVLRSQETVAVDNLTAAPHGLGAWERLRPGAWAPRRWRCINCGQIRHRSRPLPYPPCH